MIHFFLHIPKSAGISLREMIGSRYSGEQLVRVYDGQLDFWPPHTAFVNQIVQRIHEIRAVVGHYAFGAHLLAGLREVSYNCVLRDPAARIVSFFQHQTREEGARLHRLIHSGMGLRTLIEQRAAPEFNNYATRILATDTELVARHLGPRPVTQAPDALKDLQISLGYLNATLHGEEGPYDQIFHRSHLDRAVRHIQQYFCFVGIAERFTDSTRLLCDGLGWGFREDQVLFLNQTTERSTGLDSGTLDVIREYNALDYELYERFADLSFRNFR
jgi:hypothetical protein